MEVCRWFVVNPTITVRLSEEELHKLDELAQRMGLTRSDVIRSLIAKFDETLREEVEKEKKKWLAIGFTAALESAIIDPELVLRFVRRNVDILGFPDFLVGMVKVKNRVVLFSHHDRAGSQLLQLIRSRIEEDVRREEAEIEREGEDEEDVGVGRAAQIRIPASRPVGPNTIRVAPVAIRYKLVSSNKAIPPTVKPTATSTVGKPVNNNGGGSAKPTVTASVSGNKKLVTTGVPTTGSSANAQPISPNQRASTNGSGEGLADPAGQGINHKVGGDFAFALVANLYHKHRESLLRLIEGMTGD
jgi:Arc/MetJ-type ribon-helix-helix transcriptional regulator